MGKWTINRDGDAVLGDEAGRCDGAFDVVSPQPEWTNCRLGENEPIYAIGAAALGLDKERVAALYHNYGWELWATDRKAQNSGRVFELRNYKRGPLLYVWRASPLSPFLGNGTDAVLVDLMAPPQTGKEVFKSVAAPYDGHGANTPTSKDTNPKDALGVLKARWFSYIPLQVLIGVGLAFYEGARKYAKFNWRVVGVRASVYVDAAVNGHIARWQEGEDIDEESGVHHIDKAIATLMILRDSMLQGNMVDDRPPRARNIGELLKKGEEVVAMMAAKHPNAKAPFTEKQL